MRRLAASLSLDLDNKWSYLKTHGNPAWSDYPSYLPSVVPRILELLRDLDLRITFFIVGRDAAAPEHAAVMRAIVDAGHEVGNHSHSHEPWFHRYDDATVEREIADAEDAIAEATGVRPNGFRGPGYSLSAKLLDVLASRGYAFDASTLPTFIGPLARAYYFMTSRLEPEERAKRGALFGSVADALMPLRPYRWPTASGPLLEIPVTTMPIVRAPIHVSYQLYLAQYAESLTYAYFELAMRACVLTRTQPSLLLHPLDFMGGDDDADLNFFPGMGMTAARKIGIVRTLLARYRDRFDVMPMGAHARRIAAAGVRTRRAKLRPQAVA